MSPFMRAGARSPSPRRAFAAALLALLLLGGCGGDDSSGTGDDAPDATSTSTTAEAADRVETKTVVLKNIKFSPDEITVKKGETVTWQWDDGTVPHNVAFDDFKSEIQEKGTFEHAFTEAGVFEYKCTVHPTMSGSVEVTE